MRYRFYKVVLEDAAVRNWWVANLDLILDDEKFDEISGWSKGNKKKLTNAIKKHMGPNLEIIQLKDGYTQRYGSGKSGIREFACFTSDGSLCVSMFRHIRNAIAHKRATLHIYDKVRYYHLCDYSNTGKLTAEILISHETLRYFCSKYEELAHQMPEESARAA